MSQRRYFDHHASVPIGEAARIAMAAALTAGAGNPSSVHHEGRTARHRLEVARDQVAARLGGGRDEIVFTSSGSEANLQMIRAVAEEATRRGRTRLLYSPADHPSLVRAAEHAGLRLDPLPLDQHGRVQLDVIGKQLQLGNDVAAIAIAWVNHELGTMQSLAELATIAKRAGALLAVDAVQGVGRYALDVGATGVDLCTISSHKLGGPQGVGALWARREVPVPAILIGGHQERERRAGTENALGIIGFGAAAGERLDEARTARQRALGERVRDGARALGASVNSPDDAAAGLCNLAFDGVDGALLVEALDLAGFAVSTGAACSSGSVKPSSVLLAVGQESARARRGVRVSLGADADDAGVGALLEVLPVLVARIRAA